MQKQFTSRIVQAPINDKTNIRVEMEFNGSKDFTIIDAITRKSNGKTYLLLEHNTLGEEFTPIVELPEKLMWLSCEEWGERKLFIPEKYVVISNSDDDIITALEDEFDEYEDDSFVGWDEEEINREPQDLSEHAQCAWCKEWYPVSELNQESDMGYLCDQCVAAIKSRGEDLDIK